MMSASIAIVQVAHPGPTDDADSDYWRTGAGSQLSSMYGELLGMIPIYIGYHKLVHADGRLPEIGFEYAPDDPPPQWPDPDHPQQVHLDIEVDDLERAEELVRSNGAQRLAAFDRHRVYADPVGHPFCLYPSDAEPLEPSGAAGRIARIVFDCLSPRALARFYAELFGLHDVVEDTPHRVEIGAGLGMTLAFQHSRCDPPRWPDPARPAQLHLDVTVADESQRALAEALGAIHLSLPERPDNLVYADPAGHPFCLSVGAWGTPGPAQVAEYQEWLRQQAD